MELKKQLGHTPLQELQTTLKTIQVKYFLAKTVTKTDIVSIALLFHGVDDGFY